MAVNRAIADGDYDVVFGGGDDWMAALSAHRFEIDARVAHPEFSVVEAALDKLRLTELAHEVGLAAPHTELATPEALASWRGPVVVKCRTHWSPGRTEALRIEAKLFEHAADARQRLDFIQAAGEQAVLQQPVSGQLGAVIGVYHGGRLDARVQQVTSRLWPTPNGVSTRARTVPVDDLLVATCERLLETLNWRGLVELQFLTGPDGVPHLIDLNGRFFGSMALTNAARPGVADLWGQLVLGDAVMSLPDAPAGVRFSWTAGDLRRATVERRRTLARDVLDTLRWSAQATQSVWDPRDPAPTMRVMTERFIPRSDVAGDAPLERERREPQTAPGRAA
ncbi:MULTISPECIES: hypothetical protein [Brachybacterium]|uniref:hypothetical protein n=1 Tax=Brachybacterium TaxID=43668 RepID=UPI00190C8778|nr:MULTISPECIES: hypothetical protein [Brachybacterium]